MMRRPTDPKEISTHPSGILGKPRTWAVVLDVQHIWQTPTRGSDSLITSAQSLEMLGWFAFG